jgi:hypothetical protein
MSAKQPQPRKPKVGDREGGFVCTYASQGGYQTSSWRRLEEWEKTEEEKKSEREEKAAAEVRDVIRQAEELEQARLEKLPGYKFWAFAEWWIGLMWLCALLHAAWSGSWGESPSTVYFDLFGMLILFLIRMRIVRRTTAKDSLEYQDKLAAKAAQ